METGETLTLPGGVAFRLLRSAQETDGERVEFEIVLPPGAPSPPRHVHPRQEEEWHVLEGTVEAWYDGGWRTLRAGESLVVPRGRPHTIRNRSGAPARVRDVHLPALDFQGYVEDLHRAASAVGGADRRGPAALIAFATVLVEHRSTQVTASPAQRLAESVLAAVGRIRRR